VMEKRLWSYIVVPGMVASLAFGTFLAVQSHAFQEGWLHLKLLFVLGFVGYNMMLNKFRKRFLRQEKTPSAFALRMINEVGTVFLILIVMIAYLKTLFSHSWAALIIVGLLAIFAAVVHIVMKKSK